MIAKLRSIPRRVADLAKKVWENRLIVLLGIVVLTVTGIVIYWAVRPDIAPTWTGFGEHPRNEEVVPAKTLWDWMGLLIVPLVLGLGVFILNSSQRKSEQDIAEKNREADREIARDKQYQNTLEAYFDRMSTLILENGLGTDEAKVGARSIARTQTLTVLRSLVKKRVSAVFRFIDDAGLKEVVSLAKGNLRYVDWEGADLRAINLSGADLRYANLLRANLTDANLSGANLRDTNLRGAWLPYADLRGAKLFDADLRGANLLRSNLSDANLTAANLTAAYLSGADLRGALLFRTGLKSAEVSPEQLATAHSIAGATMPDGTKYEEWVKKQPEDIQAQGQGADEHPPIVDDQSSEQQP